MDITPPAPQSLGTQTIFFAGDTGVPGEEQDSLAERRLLLDPDHSIFVGDNVYQPHSAINAWTAFTSQVGIGPIHPVWGNHDHDVGLGDQFALFPGRANYYHRDLGVADLFVLNSGLDTYANVVEPDGITVGSVQYDWFVSQLEASKRAWKIVAFHHPFITEYEEGAIKVLPAFDWGFEELGVDVILNGHTHTAQIGLFAGEMLIADLSNAVRDLRKIDPLGTIHGTRPDYYQSLWNSDEVRACGVMEVSSYRLALKAVRVDTGETLFETVRIR